MSYFLRGENTNFPESLKIATDFETKNDVLLAHNWLKHTFSHYSKRIINYDVG